LAVLEFGKVLPELALRADSVWGKELALLVRPGPDLAQALAAQNELREWQALETGDPPVPGLGLPDVRESLRQAEHPGAVLEPAELLDLARVAAASRLTLDVLNEHAATAPALADRARRDLGRFPAFEAAAAAAIDERGQVKDGASPTLAKLRRRIASTRTDLHQRLERLAARIGSGSFVTQRGGRYTVAVPVEWLGRVKGVVHDRSSSEASVFLEPFEVVELGNRLRADEEEERAEVRRILAVLTAQAGDLAPALRASAGELAHLDLLRAKARLFRDWGSTLPELREGGPLALRAARHPLLARAKSARGEPVIPIDLDLGGQVRILVITGPNMGGKTVALKTLGLLTLMGMAGLGVPAAEGTALGFFPAIVADIGDEQSIEENLSTFASHLRNLRRAVEEASPRTLVLLDELGAGTDPAEGAALGQAVLEHLAASGATAVVTTHHGALKGMATDHPVIANASMAFDPATQAPLYTLVSGLPGRSLGIAVAERLGFPPAVLDRARGLVPDSERRLAALLVEVEATRLAMLAEQEEIATARQGLAALLAKYRERLAGIRELRDRVHAQARERVAALTTEVDEVLREARRLLRAAGERAASAPTSRRGGSEVGRGSERDAVGAGTDASGGADASAGASSGEGASGRDIEALGELVREIEAGAARLARQRPSPGPGEKPARIDPGDRYWVPELGAIAEVLRAPDAAGRVVVSCRGRRLALAADRLRVAPAGSLEAKPQPMPATHIEVEAPSSFEIDLRGLTGDEGVAQVERYLDQAAVHGLKMVRIIHGKGTGALRARVQDVLRSHPRVTAFRLGETGEGGAGVTVVEIA
jgi:DNA mismatch repair protein MutS2